MTEQLSKINIVFEELGKFITEDENFKNIPIRWAMYEVSPNNLSPTMIIFEAKPFEYDITQCNYSRQLDVIIVHNTDYEREITKRLSKYAEDMVELIETHMTGSHGNYEMTFVEGSEIRAKRNNKEDVESYKGSRTLYTSLIVLSYLLRY